MEQPVRNSVTVESPYGLRSFALRLGDVTDAPDPVLVVPTHAHGDFGPDGAVLQRMEERYTARFERLQPLIMAGGIIGTYRLIAEDRGTFPGREILVVRIPGLHSVESQGHDPLDVLDRAMWSLFGSLAALELKGEGLTSMALPLLAGTRGYAKRDIMSLVLRHSLGWLRGARQMSAVNFHLVDEEAVSEWISVMDDVLGRRSVDAAQNALVAALRGEILAFLGDQRLSSLSGEYTKVFASLRASLEQTKLPLERVAVDGRRLVEEILIELTAGQQITNRNGGPPTLNDRLHAVRQSGTTAPWIVAHCDCLRHFGNAAAHGGGHKSYRPPELKEEDLPAILASLHRLLQFRAGWEIGGLSGQ